ncbi:MAG: NAD(+)/NADH kinase [Actinomycetota bacterium]|nr:NAD(+)/NADH kinase [Actinomycetota bacterium]
MATVGFLAHPHRPAAIELADRAATWLRDQGHRTRMLDGAAKRPEENGSLAELDLAVSLGGDGTMLRTVDLVSPAGVAVMGVNLGQLGYLTTVEPDGLLDALARFLSGDYHVESRMTLDVTVSEGGAGGRRTVLRRSALNDVVLQRPGGGHTVRAEMWVNGVSFLTFAADALIVATPTGSTAYNLSARGPIVSPRARVQIVTPVAPHMLFDRSLVLDATDEVAFTPTESSACDVVVDGWPVTVLQPGDTLVCRQGARDARIVSCGGDRDFHGVLKHKFNLAGR